MPVPDEGTHAGHLVQQGMCADCGRGVTREDILTVPCPRCSAIPGKQCNRRGAASHIERMLRAHGHSLDAIPELVKSGRGSRKPPVRVVRSAPPVKKPLPVKKEVNCLGVACPQCKAPAGEKCRGARSERNGEPWLRDTFHASRFYIASHKKPGK